MIELDASLLPAHVRGILMLRAVQLPALTWHEHPNRMAKATLEATTSDEELLDCHPLTDEGMGAAVRALLFLWSGWPADAEMYAQLAPDVERAYIEALVRRQAGDPAQAKSLLVQVGQHLVYSPLREHAETEIGLSVAPGLKRLREMIAFAEQWEPFAFGDLFEQAREGELDPAAERIVRGIQCREFELLLEYCYEAATGKALQKRHRNIPPGGHSVEPAGARRPRCHAHCVTLPSDSHADQTPTLDLRLDGSQVWVLCPKCGAQSGFPESSRGSTANCEKCGALFRIPLHQSGAAADRE